MTIKNRNLTPGTKLVGKYHKEQHTCEVVQGEGDKVHYRLEDGREFKSPSAAGMAITGHACDGWVFWSVETTEAAPTPETQKPETNLESTTSSEDATAPEAKDATAGEPTETAAAPAPSAELGAAKKSIKRTPNQKGVSEGQTRWYCQACGESFLAPYGEIPVACPQGHKA